MYTIRKMEAGDRQAVKAMMRMFYASPAVFSNGSEEIFDADIDQCVGSSPYLEGFVFEKEKAILGYAMIAKSFSTEFGKPCIFRKNTGASGSGPGSWLISPPNIRIAFTGWRRSPKTKMPSGYTGKTALICFPIWK